jgi:nitroimidazol reductase NimA-like FMN-containing flavoprotein (pyridoxamine 5'-phosphate oxidase superfamily)
MTTPHRLRRLLFGGAVDNARRAAAEITAAVADRRVLAAALESAPHRGDLVRLTRGQCTDRLASKSVGRLAYVARHGVPDIVPVNYELDGEDVIIRCAPGPKLQAAERGEVVAFEVDDLDDDLHTGWSVVVVGRAVRISPLLTDRAGTHLPESWARGPRRHGIRIHPGRIDGRRLL